MITSEMLEKKFNELERLLIAGGYKEAQSRQGVPFIVLLYPPEEEIQVRKRVSLLRRKLESVGWKIRRFQPEPLLLEFLESKGRSKEAFDAERRDASQLRSNIATDLFVKHLTRLGGRASSKEVLFVLRAGGFYPHVNIHALQERLAGTMKTTTVFFIPAVETEGKHYLFMGSQKTQKYRGYYI